VDAVLPAAPTVLVELEPFRVIAPVLLGRIVPLFTLGAGETDDDAVFL
jgi:hypothetical protein